MEAKLQSMCKARIIDLEFKISHLGILGKAYYELALIKLKRHRSQISIARTQNLLLHTVLDKLREDDRIAKKNAGDLETLRKTTSSLRALFDHQRNTVFKRQIQLETQITKTHAFELDCAGVLDPTSPLQMRIQSLEHRLAWIQHKMQNLQILVREYECSVQPLRDDWIVYDSKLAALQNHVTMKNQECELLINTHHDAIRARDAAKIELEELLAFIFGYGKKGLISPDLKIKILKAIKEIKSAMDVGSMREMYNQFILQEKQSAYLDSILEEMTKLKYLLKAEASSKRRSMMQKDDVQELMDGSVTLVRRHSTIHPTAPKGSFPLLKLLEGTKLLVDKLSDGHSLLAEQNLETSVIETCKDKLVLILQSLHRQLKRHTAEVARKERAAFEAREAAHWRQEEAEAARKQKLASDERKQAEEREPARASPQREEESSTRGEQRSAPQSPSESDSTVSSTSVTRQTGELAAGIILSGVEPSDARLVTSPELSDAGSAEGTPALLARDDASGSGTPALRESPAASTDHDWEVVSDQRIGEPTISAGELPSVATDAVFEGKTEEVTSSGESAEPLQETFIGSSPPSEKIVGGPEADEVTESTQPILESAEGLPASEVSSKAEELQSTAPGQPLQGPISESAPPWPTAVIAEGPLRDPTATKPPRPVDQESTVVVELPDEQAPLFTSGSPALASGESIAVLNNAPTIAPSDGELTQPAPASSTHEEVPRTESQSGELPTAEVASSRAVNSDSAAAEPTQTSSDDEAARPGEIMAGLPEIATLQIQGPIGEAQAADEFHPGSDQTQAGQAGTATTTDIPSRERSDDEISSPVSPQDQGASPTAEPLSREGITPAQPTPAQPTQGTNFESTETTPKALVEEPLTAATSGDQIAALTTEVDPEGSEGLRSPQSAVEGGSPKSLVEIDRASEDTIVSGIPSPTGVEMSKITAAQFSDEGGTSSLKTETLSSSTPTGMPGGERVLTPPPTAAEAPSDSATISSIDSSSTATITDIPLPGDVLAIDPAPADKPSSSQSISDVPAMIPIQSKEVVRVLVLESKDSSTDSPSRTSDSAVILPPVAASHDSESARPVSAESRLARSPSGAPIASGAKLPSLDYLSLEESGPPRKSSGPKSPNFPRSPSGAPIATAVKFPLSPFSSPGEGTRVIDAASRLVPRDPSEPSSSSSAGAEERSPQTAATSYPAHEGETKE